MMQNSASLHVLFRADANSAIASGHVARCSIVAGALERRGVRCTLVVSDEESRKVACDRFRDVVVIGSDWQNPDDEDMGYIVSARRDGSVVLVLDTYSATRRYVERAIDFAPVCYLGLRDDCMGPLSAIIDYGIVADRTRYEKMYRQYDTRVLIGPRYAPLSPEYSQSRPRSPRKEVKRVLLTTGGSDLLGVVPTLLRAVLKRRELSNLAFDVVVGPLFDNYQDLLGEFGNEGRISLHYGLTNLYSLMGSCDIAVTAAGTTVYELAALGVPSIVFSSSVEQHESAMRLGKLEVMDYCAGYLSGSVSGRIVEKLVELSGDWQKRCNLSSASRFLVDGKGVERIADCILGFAN